MFFLIKCVFYFSVSFMLMTIPMGKRTLFDHLHSATAPYSKAVYSKIIHLSQRGLEFSSKLFSNSDPSRVDKVNITQSAIKKESPAQIPLDEYTHREKELLDKILSNSEASID